MGLTLVEPLAAVEVKDPGESFTVVAPVAAQLSLLLEPELMLVGLARKELMVGAEPLPVEGDEPTDAQPAKPMQTAAAKSRAKTGRSPRQSCVIPVNELGESMGSSSVAIDEISLGSRQGCAYWPQVQKETVGLRAGIALDRKQARRWRFW